MTLALASVQSVHSRDTIPDLDVMVRASYPDYIRDLYQLIDVIYSSEQEVALNICDDLRRAAIAAHSKEWELEADFLEVEYLIIYKQISPEVSLARYKRLMKDSRDYKSGIFRIHVLWGYFKLLWSIRDYEHAFAVLREFSQLLESVSIEDFYRKPGYLYSAGAAYYSFNDYSAALRMLRPLDRLPLNPDTKYPKLNSANTIGLIYQQMGDLDSSDYYLQRVLSLSDMVQDSAWIGIASGNLGKNAFLRGDYETAIPLLQLDYDLAWRFRDYGLAAGSGTILADIYIRTDEPKKAKVYLDSSFSCIRRSKQSHRFRFLYPVMAKYQAEIGNPKKTVAFLDSAEQYRNLHEKEFNSILLVRVKQNEHQTELDGIKAAEARQKIIWNAAIIVMALIAITLAVVLYSHRQRNRMRHEISEMERIRQTRELEEAQSQLDRFADQIVRHEALIQKLHKEAKSKEDGTVMRELRKSRILTEDDWRLFKDRFNMVHGGFIHTLKSRFSHLTPSEIRFLSLAKLGLSKSEIAAALGVSIGSLRVTWHRIRKKLNSPDGATPESFIRKMTEGNK